MRRAVCLVACAALTGCGGHSHGHSRDPGFPVGAVAEVAVAAAAQMISAAAEASAAQAADPDPWVDPSPDYLLAAPLPPRVPSNDPAHEAFDPVPVLQAIDALDLSVCTGSGALIGWGHARLTFEPRGVVTRVVVDSTAGLSSEAILCIQGQLATVSAARFDGPPITIGARYFVR